MIEISLIGADHAAQLAGLQRRAFKQAYADVHSRRDLEAYCRANYSTESAAVDLSSKQTVCCVGWLNSTLAGYYLIKHQACPATLDSESSELKQLYVLSSAYGSGLGRALHDHALASIRSAGRGCVWLCVSDTNHRARAFYAKLGFAKVGAGAILEVGKDWLASSILAHAL